MLGNNRTGNKKYVLVTLISSWDATLNSYMENVHGL